MYMKEEWNFPGAVERIKDQMKLEGISRKELARKCGMSYGNLSRILSGNYVALTDDFRAKLIHGTGWNGLWIFFGIRREGA